MPAGDVFGLDGFFLNKSNPVIVSTIGINSTGSSAGIAVTGGSFNAGNFTLNLSNAVGLSTTPFYTGAKIAVSGLKNTSGVAHTGYNGTFVVTGFAGTTTVSYATSSYVGIVTAGITTTGLVILVTDTQVTNTIWSTAQTHGWFGAGYNGPTAFSTVDRIDFSNDTGTVNIRSPLSLARSSLAATGNSNYGWFGGGFGTEAVSTVDRINFSNDSSTASVRGPLSLARSSLAATGNSNYGWFGGGAAPGSRSTVDRIDFSNDSSTASVRGPLSGTRYNFSATGNSNYGWFGGGSGSNAVDRIDFSNDLATASPRSSLLSTTQNCGATGNSNYGWFGGASITFGPGPVRYSTVNRIDFSNDSSTASIRGPLSLAREKLSATGNSNYGWFGGGTPGPLSTVDRINFSNDSATASVRGSLSSARYAMGATSGQARSSSIRLQKAGNYGWFGGGSNYFSPSTPSQYFSLIDRINFSNDSVLASVRGSLSSARYGVGATGNSNYGWFGGGTSPAPPTFSTVDRIDFSNDSATASIRGNLPTETRFSTATGNSNYGWFGGGYYPAATPSLLSRVTRIDFSNDLSSTVNRGRLNYAEGRKSATGNSNYGWFVRGTNSAPSLVDRVDFSNDSSTASPRGPLSSPRYDSAATGNSNYGWFGGGSAPASPYITSTVDRIDFSNDSSTASPRGVLVIAVRGLSATGNSNYGWFGGGYVSPGSSGKRSIVSRIDFSNDNATASSRGLLTATRYSIGATSNTPT